MCRQIVGTPVYKRYRGPGPAWVVLSERVPWSGCRLCSLLAKDARRNPNLLASHPLPRHIDTTSCASLAQGAT